MPDRKPATQAYFVDALVYARFSDGKRARAVDLAGLRSRPHINYTTPSGAKAAVQAQ